MLDARLAGATADAAVAAELARGALPPGKLSGPVIDKLLPEVEQIVRHAAALLPGAAEPGSVDVRVTLPDGRRLSGTVPDVYGDAAAQRHVLARERRGIACGLGAASSRSPPRTPTARSRRRPWAARSTAPAGGRP